MLLILHLENSVFEVKKLCTYGCVNLVIQLFLLERSPEQELMSPVRQMLLAPNSVCFKIAGLKGHI